MPGYNGSVVTDSTCLRDAYGDLARLVAAPPLETLLALETAGWLSFDDDGSAFVGYRLLLARVTRGPSDLECDVSISTSLPHGTFGHVAPALGRTAQSDDHGRQ